MKFKTNECQEFRITIEEFPPNSLADREGFMIYDLKSLSGSI